MYQALRAAIGLQAYLCVCEREREIVCERERDGAAIVKLLVYDTLRGAVGQTKLLVYEALSY